MTQANVEVIRGAYGVFDTDLDGLLDRLDQHVEWISPADAIEPGVRRGHVGVREAFAATAMAWEDASHTLDQLFDAGDHVLATITFRGHGRGSGMDAERTEFHVWTVRNRLVTRFEWFYRRRDALIAAGLPSYET